MPEWDAEIEFDAPLARTLIAGRYPTVDVASLRPLGEGWDNRVWATADGIAFRFPRRAIALPGIEREIAILPELAARLPASVPDAAYPGDATSEFPWPWFGSRLIDGAELAAAGPRLHDRRRLAAELGAFLRALHALRLPGAEGLPIDPLGRADMGARVPRTRAALEQLGGDADGRAAPILAAAERLSAATEAPVLVHGDLNLRHALVDADGGLAGVIDWGDMCRAPRAVDLPLYWSAFHPAEREAFRAAYGEIADATLVRARVLALFMDATLAVYAAAEGMAELEREALAGLARTVAD